MHVGQPKRQKGVDEFQLLQFILGFKGIQFISGGIVLAITGAMQYYYCVRDDNCDTHGPGTADGTFWGLLEFGLNVGLVLLNFDLFWSEFGEINYS